MNICICDFGYEVFQQKYCHPCQWGSQCQCQQGYAFNSRSFQCKPLCNGSFDGCIRGTCIDYNECLCDNGTEKISDDNFRCYVKEAGQIIFPNIYHNIDRRWYLMLLTIPVVIVVVSFCVVIKRWRSSKANRLRAQKHNFPEIRYFNTNNNHRVDSKHEEASAGRRRNEPGLCESVIHHEGGVLVIKV
ncbi:uncharacterized protein LOC129912977 [Episyrphus balteatus]|uniref:uncharacterized protein LOC129912977 n=1 Tax=Episyrphus balteatus TaxID=286459 RepID=UPI00248561EE|nr:uncharacterized protein LOC129912977 [Episyrphus balteatus]